MALSQERKGTIAVSLTNFLDSGCIVASSVALAAWAVAFNFGSAWTAILGAVGANAFGAAVGALIGGFLTDKLGRKFIYTYNMLVYATGVFIVMIAANLPMLVIGIVISGLSVGAGVGGIVELHFRDVGIEPPRVEHRHQPVRLVMRSGCYLPHLAHLLARVPHLRREWRAAPRRNLWSF